MELKVIKREAQKKSQAGQLRREAKIPAIVYHGNNPGETIAVDDAEFQAILRSIKPGHLSTTQFTLTKEDGAKAKAIVKEIQYHPTTYKIQHLDFQELKDDMFVNLNVPVVYKGAADCVGIKLGGVVRQPIRMLEVRCLPKDIPESFILDITKLSMNQSLKLKDIAIPEGVRPRKELKAVVLTIVKR